MAGSNQKKKDLFEDLIVDELKEDAQALKSVQGQSNDVFEIESLKDSPDAPPPLKVLKSQTQEKEKAKDLPLASSFSKDAEDSSPVFVENIRPLHSNLNELQDQLKKSNYLEIAQSRVLELEKEIQKLRRDSEQIATAGKHFKELSESLKNQVKQSESNYLNLQEITKEEKKILMQSLEAKEIKIAALQDRIQDVEGKQGSQYENIRLRERELENRLEILKSEGEALSQVKDEKILELKKQLSSLNSDLEKYRSQNQKLVVKVESKEELLRKTVKALRIALTMLEGHEKEET